MCCLCVPWGKCPYGVAVALDSYRTANGRNISPLSCQSDIVNCPHKQTTLDLTKLNIKVLSPSINKPPHVPRTHTHTRRQLLPTQERQFTTAERRCFSPLKAPLKRNGKQTRNINMDLKKTKLLQFITQIRRHYQHFLF